MATVTSARRSVLPFAKRISRRRRIRVGDIAAVAMLVPLSAMFLYPFAWIFSTAVMPPTVNPYLFPPRLLPWLHGWAPTLAHFRELASTFPFFLFLTNSLIYVVGQIVPMLLICSMAGYALARWRFPGRDVIFTLILATFIIPGEVTLIPGYLVVRAIMGVDNYQCLIVPAWVSTFTIFLMRQAFLGLPGELEDSATVDGANEFRAYAQIMLPLVKPTLAFAAVTAFAGTWGDFMGPLIYLKSQKYFPVTLGILMLNSAFYGSFNLICAGMVFSALPIGLVFLFAQKYFVRGLAEGAIKG
ncbi:MAG: carbohydrate ABC transporter permease [Anaerolineae bacterium]